MKFRKISTKMLATILPVIIIAMVVLTVVSVNSSEKTINQQIATTMEAELMAQDGAMGEYLDSVSNMSTMIANMVEVSYTATDMSEYEAMLGNIILDNNIVLGSGLWFEPYAYDSSEEYMGPYVYKDGASLVTTYDYSNADYDYFNQEYYTMCINATKAQFTDPYYDETSDTIMSSCSCPMIVNGKYIGCVTVDIELSSITNLIKNIRVGQAGSAILITGDGTYLAGVSDEKVANAVNIAQDDNASVAKAGAAIVASESGVTECDMGGKMNMYYSTLADTGWKLILLMPQSELNGPVDRLVIMLVIVSVIALAFAVVLVLLQVRSIAKSIGTVQVFAGSLAGGDFTIEPIQVKTQDELGSMGESLNQMYDNNKGVINNIKIHAGEIDDASMRLKDASNVLAAKFEDIQTYMNDVNSAMLNTSAATEEVNASTEEVLSNVNLLAAETDESMNMARDIRKRASEVGTYSKNAYDSATKLSGEFKARLDVSIENAKVVESIGQLANVISEIAEQINLLSLNASIEAARAGEAGRGFAVVASEIGGLAGNTAEAVGKIQDTIEEVKSAFNGLTADAHDLLGFVQDTVAPDYRNFVEIAKQYGNDAEAVDSSADKISNMSDAIKAIMQEVTDAIQSIAEATQSTTDLSSNIVESIEQISVNVGEISEMSDSQGVIVKDLNEVVGKFTLE